jgi:ribosomal protein S18 acetylase RimI-like enzyme
MDLRLEPIREAYREGCLAIFNQIIAEGETFPFDVPFSREEFDAKYIPEEPVWCAIGRGTDGAEDVLGFVHIHPNGIGRCAHVANCGYSVRRDVRGCGIGRKLVAKSIEVAAEMGFLAIQFNAVVSTNAAALALYRSFGFQTLGTVPNGFRLGDGADARYVDMHVMHLPLR